MEQWGARSVDRDETGYRRGDIFIQPLNNTHAFEYAGQTPPDLPLISVGRGWVLPLLAVMQRECGAGFYSDIWGPTPYCFAAVPPDSYLVFQMRGPMRMVVGGGR